MLNITDKDQRVLMDILKIGVYIDDYQDIETMPVKTFLLDGVVFVDSDGKILTEVPADIARIAYDKYAITNLDWSKSFHKSWEKVKTASTEQLVFEQIIHYISTYGFEAMGKKVMPVIPAEEILVDMDQIPNFKGFTFIVMLNDQEAKRMVQDYFASIIAPNKLLIDDLIGLMPKFEIRPELLKSYELKVARYEQTGTVPVDGEEFLRFLVYKTTYSTLLIKNTKLINSIKINKRNEGIVKYFEQADLRKLAECFYRYKPLWLTYKKFPGCAPYINKLNKLAKRYHKPMSEVSVQNVSKLMKNSRFEDIEAIIRQCSMRQLIKLYNFVVGEYNATDNTSVQIYNIRNGKIWVSADHEPMNPTICRVVLLMILSAIRERKAPSDVAYYIPEYIDYTAPITEKQFIGAIPLGTKLNTGGNNVFAIYWEDYQKCRTDIDLHVRNATEHFGWCGAYRDSEQSILYSGDMTSAQDGAVEAFKFNSSAWESDKLFVLSANNYTRYSDVPFKFFITDKFEQSSDGEAIVEIKDAALPPLELKFKDSNNINIGLIAKDEFYFYPANLGLNIVPRNENDAADKLLQSIHHRCKYMMSLRQLLADTGATVIRTEEERKKYDGGDIIDLSPSAINSQSLLDIVDSYDN